MNIFCLAMGKTSSSRLIMIKGIQTLMPQTFKKEKKPVSQILRLRICELF